MITTATDPSTSATVTQVADAIRTRQRFVLSSHVRPDGDAIGSQMAMAYALRHLGKEVRIVNRDSPPSQLAGFPGVDGIIVADTVDEVGDAVIVMESGTLERTGVAGLDRGFVINIDHHLGNSMYGAVNWFDTTAAACGQMVFDLIRELGVPISRDIATHVYIAILTDTGSFHYSSLSPRTFEISAHCLEAGVDPVAIARAVYDTGTVPQMKIWGAVFTGMEVDASGRLAIMSVDRGVVAACGGTYDDTEGLNNAPLQVKEIQAVVFFKENGPDDWRVSMRSKGDVDINAVAKEFGGGGHKNASGCSATGRLEDITRVFREKILRQIEAAG